MNIFNILFAGPLGSLWWNSPGALPPYCLHITKPFLEAVPHCGGHDSTFDKLQHHIRGQASFAQLHSPLILDCPGHHIMFTESSNFTITHSSLSVNQINGGQTGGIESLYHETIHEAAFDSDARDPPPRCFPGTRTKDIRIVVSWASPSSDQSPPLLWVKGKGGAGKSALAQTCIEELENMGIPFAAFFFSQDRGWNNHRKFILTIAYQLSTQLPEYRTLLDAKIRQDRSLLYHKRMATQFKELILDPFRELGRTGIDIRRRIPIFVDALDECDTITAQHEMVQLVASATEKLPHTFCWAFFSRPETHIEEAFSHCYLNPHYLQTIALPRFQIPDIIVQGEILPLHLATGQRIPLGINLVDTPTSIETGLPLASATSIVEWDGVNRDVHSLRSNSTHNHRLKDPPADIPVHIDSEEKTQGKVIEALGVRQTACNPPTEPPEVGSGFRAAVKQQDDFSAICGMLEETPSYATPLPSPCNPCTYTTVFLSSRITQSQEPLLVNTSGALDLQRL
ncbi:hypothetical protein D9756_007942 [Leucocoprinus leucothites]|uniref:Nephrocystin 3-like N-terminal domain-containing protein n=1 Tax=Leucocoprinus leucothites TaxID=201217 RepID=A0A8H5D455_9AGAR|nr:hypothetical protein D9756_007942 [Leucoagaricus leucothites]